MRRPLTLAVAVAAVVAAAAGLLSGLTSTSGQARKFLTRLGPQ